MWVRKSGQSGFTIIELLVVIVVIGILSTLVLVAYNGVQDRANNASRLSEINTWRKLFELYKAQNGTYPLMPDGGYCLGTGFPGGKCRDYLANNVYTLTEAGSTALMDKIKTVAPIPQTSHVGVNETVGPYVYYGSMGWFEITGVFKGGASDCPKGLNYMWDDGNGRLLCYIDVLL